MTAKKRDQPHHDLVRQHLPGLILNTIPGIIPEFGDPYVAKPDLGGTATYQPRIITAASRTKVGAPFRYAESLLATLAVVKSMTGLPYRHLHELESANIYEVLKSSYTASRIAPFKLKCTKYMQIKEPIRCHDYDEDVFTCVKF